MTALVEESMFKKDNAAIIISYLSVKERSLLERESYLNNILQREGGEQAIYSAYLKARKKLKKLLHSGQDSDKEKGNINSDGEDMTSDNFQIQYLFNPAAVSSHHEDEDQIKMDMRVFRDLDIVIGNRIMQERLAGIDITNPTPSNK